MTKKTSADHGWRCQIGERKPRPHVFPPHINISFFHWAVLPVLLIKATGSLTFYIVTTENYLHPAIITITSPRPELPVDQRHTFVTEHFSHSLRNTSHGSTVSGLHVLWPATNSLCQHIIYFTLGCRLILFIVLFEDTNVCGEVSVSLTIISSLYQLMSRFFFLC